MFFVKMKDNCDSVLNFEKVIDYAKYEIGENYYINIAVIDNPSGIMYKYKNETERDRIFDCLNVLIKPSTL